MKFKPLLIFVVLLLFLVSNAFAVVRTTDMLGAFTAAKVGGTAPTFDEVNKMYYFEDHPVAAQEDYAFISLQTPHQRINNSDIECHIHWAPSTSGAGNVTWEINYTFANMRNETFAGSTVKQVTAKTAGVALQHQYTSFGVINGSGKDISSILNVKVTRKSSLASDTYTGNAYVPYFDCHYKYNDNLQPVKGDSNMGLGLIVALGIAIAIMAYMAFAFKSESNGTTAVWRVISLIMVVLLLVILAWASIQSQKDCAYVPNESTYEYVCSDSPMTAGSTFLKLTLLLTTIFFVWICVALAISSLEYFRSTGKL